ncbi:hypothetical protein NPIL_309141 [Nephila pilipes]|uniref:Uncharacterized protein n=1 Tax=Nephila pilipes TaxID=299642 RepID=A0A8X6N9I7_NEPPI|nr:hypothetical protein NPIL_309141 [Nephila pilipes]
MKLEGGEWKKKGSVIPEGVGLPPPGRCCSTGRSCRGCPVGTGPRRHILARGPLLFRPRGSFVRYRLIAAHMPLPSSALSRCASVGCSESPDLALCVESLWKIKFAFFSSFCNDGVTR